MSDENRNDSPPNGPESTPTRAVELDLESKHGQVWDTSTIARRLPGYWLHGPLELWRAGNRTACEGR